MKKYLYILLSSVIAVAILGCSEGENVEPTPDPIPPKPTPQLAPYYIARYTIVETIRCSVVTEFMDALGIFNYDLFPLQPPVILMSFDGENIEDSEDNEQFVYFQEMYGDTQYNGETNPDSNAALAYPIEKITMVCHEDFDAEHPAGSAVDDIVKMHISTYETFINNGYEYPADWQHRKYYGWGVMPVGEFYLSDVNEDNSTLMPTSSGMPYLKFMKEPDVAGDYPFTLEITFNGETVKTRLLITFGNTAK